MRNRKLAVDKKMLRTLTNAEAQQAAGGTGTCADYTFYDCVSAQCTVLCTQVDCGSFAGDCFTMGPCQDTMMGCYSWDTCGECA